MKSSIITLKEKKRATTSVATLPSKKTAEWCSLLLSFAAIAVAFLGFISIDCGIEDGSSYDDPITNLNYVSDSPYIDTGINANVSAAYATSAMELGVNLWKTINVTDPAATIRTEALAVALGESFSVCLLNTGKGTPFVSGMDVRPLKDGVYPGLNATLSAVVHNRLNMGPTSGAIRYPDDKYDRIWEAYSSPQWTEISTDSTVNNLSVDGFEPPTAVMQTAVTPENSLTLNFTLELDLGDLSEIVVAVLYFSEFLTLTGNMSRQFYIYFNGALWFQKPFVPEYLLSDSVYGIASQTGYWQYNITLQALSNSTLPPILNAMEIMAAMGSSNEATDGGDVDAISGIKESYQVKRNWRGDPCSPKDFAWDGINCTFSLSEPPRITRINLSSSGLNGTISTAFATLAAIQYLDLSYNNITGAIPGFLAHLSSLKILDLTNNNLTGSIPSALLTEAQNGLLTLRLEGNPYLCTNESSCQLTPASTKKKITAPVIVILGVLPLLLVVLVVFLVWRYRTDKGYGRASHVSQQNQPIFNRIQKRQDSPLQFENRQFTYLELKNITDNFKRVLGKGGFGTVYYGCLENGIEVAVKMRSPSTSQEPKEFLYEAQFLMRVHHKNLVSMLGFCKDGDYMGLVYDYMAQGTVENHLRGRTQNAASLSWRQRLQIALESAQGLDYLHKSCKPSIIHRDVKTANILLSETFEAKIADFGISKTLSETNTHVSTIIIGTKGYLDPEYHITGQLSRKSDVYSFGVVILELITGKPAIITSEDNVHISHWIQQRLARGSIEDVVDARMHGEYSANSVWKCISIALACLAVLPYQRPTMANVVSQLKRSLELENLHFQNRRTVTNGETVFTSSLKQSSSQ